MPKDGKSERRVAKKKKKKKNLDTAMNSVTGSKTGRSGYTLASVARTPRIDWQREGAGHQTLSPRAFVTLNIAPVNCS